VAASSGQVNFFVQAEQAMRKMTAAIQQAGDAMAKINKALTTPYEDLLYEILDEVQKGNGAIHTFQTSVDATGYMTIDVEIVMHQSVAQNLGNPLARPMNIKPGTPRQPMNFSTGPTPIVVRQSDQVYVGYRDFIWIPEQGLLASRNKVTWPPYKAIEAICTARKKHDAPDEHCQCGIYAFDTPTHSDLDDNAWIWGEVALWGDVLVCQSGYRAEFAYPQCLFMTDDGLKITRRTREAIEQTYGVPVHLVDHRAGQTAQSYMADALEGLVREFEKGKTQKPPIKLDFGDLDI
jgi:hypothetical protein